jgi:hypothetical protein
MASPVGKKPVYPNLFYVLVVLAGTAFVVTAMGWLAAPMIQQKAKRPGGPGAGSLALAAWFDRWSPTALAVELVVLIVAGVLAMLADRWFRGDPSSQGPSR